MRKWFQLLFDLSVVSVSMYLSLLTGDTNPFLPEINGQGIILIAIFAATAGGIFTASGMHKIHSCGSGFQDNMLIVKAVSASSGIAVWIVFLSGLQQGMTLLIVFTQWAMTLSLLNISRFVYSLIAADTAALKRRTENVLIIGISELAGKYLRCLGRETGNHINVLGILDETGKLPQRHIDSFPVLGEPAEIPGILARYRQNGIAVNRAIVAVPMSTLSSRSQGILTYYETGGAIRFVHLEREPDGLSGRMQRRGASVDFSEPGGVDKSIQKDNAHYPG